MLNNPYRYRFQRSIEVKSVSKALIKIVPANVRTAYEAVKYGHAFLDLGIATIQMGHPKKDANTPQ
jgi:hypothetical protein